MHSCSSSIIYFDGCQEYDFLTKNMKSDINNIFQMKQTKNQIDKI